MASYYTALDADDVVSNFDEPDLQLDGDHSRCLMHNVLEVRADFEFGGQNTGRSVRLHDQQRWSW